MNIRLPAILLLWSASFFPLPLASGQAPASGKPVVYNKASAGDNSIDAALRSLLSDRYTITDVSEADAYVSPKPISGEVPSVAKSETGETISGYVLLVYVANSNGTATDATILRSTDERLNKTALDSTKTFRFTPGTVNGNPANTSAAQEFVFESEDAAKLTKDENVILYQPNDVLEKRLPDGPQPLAEYIKRLLLVYGVDLLKKSDVRVSSIVVAVRPGQYSRVWLIPRDSTVLSPDQAVLQKKLEAVAPMETQGGPVLFAISSKETPEPQSQSGFQPPMPAEWREIQKNASRPLGMDELLDAVWPAGK